jgi:hypothetical protein
MDDAALICAAAVERIKNMARRIIAALMICLLFLLAGCEIPAQTYWSPDGMRAAYVPSSGVAVPAAVIDAQGNVIARLAPAVGGFAWSSDSKKLYFVSIVPKPQNLAPTPIQRGWANVPGEQPIAATQPEDNKEESVIVNLWDGSRITPLFNVPRGVPYTMALSPDQNYLALIMNDEKWSALYVYGIAAKKLSLLSFQCGKTACFTGPRRLAFVEPTSMVQDQPADIGQLVEVNLDDQAEKLERARLLLVFTKFTPWLQPLGDDILLTTLPFAFPGIVPGDMDLVGAGLFRYSRADNSVKNLVENVGQYFTPSPNEKLVLFEKVHNHADPASRGSDLAILDVAGNTVHVVADAKVAAADADGAMHSGMPAFPAWRTSDEISFTSPTEPNKAPVLKDDRGYFDLSLYRLTPQFKLEPLRMLSEKWPVEMKPSINMK